MELLYNSTLVNEIVTQLFRHRRNDYSEHQLDHALTTHHLLHHRLPLTNSSYEQLAASLFLPNGPMPTTCIVFLHGYGSNRLECSNLLPWLDGVALCALDFSGSGKSQGDRVTYGVKEKGDIDCALNYLRRTGFKRFVLWGRSMGATSALLYCLHHRPTDVLLQVVDSPYYSFQMIAFEIASRSAKAPEFAISFALEMAKKNCAKFQHNPFDIQLTDIGSCQTPALFVYCEQDNVINCKNTHLICGKYQATFQKLIIQENHNTMRSSDTIGKIFTFVTKYLQPSRTQTLLNRTLGSSTPLNRTLGISTPPNRTLGRSITSSPRAETFRQSKKGIKRVEQQSINSNANHSQKFDDYGIWVASKFKPTPGHSEQPSMGKKIGTVETPRRLHLSLSTSLVKDSKGERTSIKGLNMGREDSYSYDREDSIISGSKPSLLGRRSKVGVRALGGRNQLNNSKYL